MRLNLPNTLTLIRIFLVPLLVVVLLTPPWRVRDQLEHTEALRLIGALTRWLADWREIVGVLIFLTAAATDWLDGYLARSRGEVTTLGKLLDPIADKLLTVSAFISLVEMGLAPAWMVVVIVGREFVVSAIRSIAATQGIVIAASVWGKGKTVAQVVAISLLILTRYHDPWVPYVNLGKAALWVVMVFAVGSMLHYGFRFVKGIDLGAET